MLRTKLFTISLTAFALQACSSQPASDSVVEDAKNFTLTAQETFTAPGADVLVFNNAPGGTFSDAKTSGVEIIHQGERTVTNGDVRLVPTPEQWDALAQLDGREVDREQGTITAFMSYPEFDFHYRIRTSTRGNTVQIEVLLEQPLPSALIDKAGFNLEFLPSVYWGKTYMADDKVGLMPRSASNAPGMRTTADGYVAPQPIATAQTLVLAPEDPQHRIKIHTSDASTELALYDGRSKAQNGWYVVRSPLPAAKTGSVLKWQLTLAAEANWQRAPVIGFSQVGYHPQQRKVATVELDRNSKPTLSMQLWRLDRTGSKSLVKEATPKIWGDYLRYHYLQFDFTEVQTTGLYQLKYGEQWSGAFPIQADVYANAWQPTLDFFLPVQMDHMKVKDAYRTWHGASHLDDALQAPPNYEHFDLFAHGNTTDTDFKPFEHIPGLNIGGWYDAGDYDIRTQSQYQTVLNLVHTFEEFGIERDNTTVLQDKRYVQINRPDGHNDLLQQIEHGTLALIAQHRAVGHAIPGIVAGRLYQYPHLGDGSTKTDNRIYKASLDTNAKSRKAGKAFEPSTVDPTPLETSLDDDGQFSGRFDDRWAFTTNATALNYGSAAALAGASRVLKRFNPELAKECLSTAQRVWKFEAGREPNRYRFGNTTGGRVEDERLKAAAELLLATGDSQYRRAVADLLPQLQEPLFADSVMALARVQPLMGSQFDVQLQKKARAFATKIQELGKENPFGVLITRAGWAGNGVIMDIAASSYWFNKLYPNTVDSGLLIQSLNYLYGTHPDSNYSFVSGVGAQSQTNAYGSNRADFSFIPGGIVPGVLVLQPDYPENKSNWPFFWGQNEYVIPLSARYIFLVNAADRLLNSR